MVGDLCFLCGFWLVTTNWWNSGSLGGWVNHSVSVLWWLRLSTHQKWLPHHCKTHVRCFITFICCGCAYWSAVSRYPCPMWNCSWKFLYSASLLGGGANHSVLQWWLRLKTHPRWLSYHCETHIRCFTTFKCCGWSQEWVLPHYHCSRWPSYWSYMKIWVFPKEQTTVCCCGEAIYSFKMALTPLWITYKMWFTSFICCGMDESLPSYLCHCRPSYLKFYNLNVRINSEVQTTVCCCDWGYIPTTMTLPS